MRIRVLSVFEGVVYHCWPVDTDQPCRPTLEVDAVLRPGDADAEAGPLLLSVADYVVFAGGLESARPCLQEFAAQGRIVEHLGADYLSFPTWTRMAPPPAGASDARGDGPGVPGPPDLRIVPPPTDGPDPHSEDPRS